MKKAFTLLELIFVILIIGIISVITFPKIGNGKLRKAANQVVSHIRYTQHLAMSDDKYDKNNINWFKARWTIVFNSDAFTNNRESYTIFSDLPSYSGNPGTSEPAINPLNSSKMLSGGFTGGPNSLDIRHLSFAGTDELNIGTTYGITNVIFNTICQSNSSKRLSFDHIGRPLIGKMSSYLTPYTNNRILSGICQITLVNSEGNATISIDPETGYVRITQINI